MDAAYHEILNIDTISKYIDISRINENLYLCTGF